MYFGICIICVIWNFDLQGHFFLDFRRNVHFLYSNGHFLPCLSVSMRDTTYPYVRPYLSSASITYVLVALWLYSSFTWTLSSSFHYFSFRTHLSYFWCFYLTDSQSWLCVRIACKDIKNLKANTAPYLLNQ